MLFLLAVLVLVPLFGAAACWASTVNERWERAAVLGMAAACLGGLWPAARAFLGIDSPSLRWAWNVPGGALALGCDPLSGMFLCLVFGLSAVAALFGWGYARGLRAHKSTGPLWLFWGLWVFGMGLTACARNALLFLMAWEIMSLSSFFLVSFEHERAQVRRAGWIYLAASQAGTALLTALVMLLARRTGSLDFEVLARGDGAGGTGLLFVLALAGFGVKAGLVPLHIWLPEAHPAAPSPVSALLSGVALNMGLYGLLRFLSFLGAPQAWWGVALIGAGGLSALVGAVWAMAQNDLKRLLAYSSVENMGLITVGIGLGFLGVATGSASLAVWGMGGGFVHLVNHAVFKTMLFLCAGSVVQGAGTGQIDLLGGLLERWPRTGAAFFVGAVSLSALPGANGFAGEFLLYGAAFLHQGSPGGAAPLLLLVIAVLSLSGGVALAVAAKSFGLVFLGAPRSPQAHPSAEPRGVRTMTLSGLAALCVVLGCVPAALLKGLRPVLTHVVGAVDFSPVERALWGVTAGLGTLALLAGAAGAVFLVLRRRRGAATGPVWACGYAFVSSRMQYSGSSFTQPLEDLFAPLLRERRTAAAVQGFFASPVSFQSETPDAVDDRLARPLFARLQQALFHGRRLQHGRLQLYVLYIVLTLIGLLLFALR